MNTINPDDIKDLQVFLEALEPNMSEKELFNQDQKALKTVHQLRKLRNGQQQKPQPKMNNTMVTIKTDKIEKTIHHLMKVVDKEIENHGQKAFDKLVEAIDEKMGDDIYKSRAGELMEFVFAISQPEHEKKHLCLSAALGNASDDTLFQLVKLVDSAL